MARIIDGKAIADEMVDAIAVEVASLGMVPGLAVVRVGEDPASAVYVRTKLRQCTRAGMRSIERHLSAEVGEAALLAEIEALNRDDTVHGILVQLPLPEAIDTALVLEAVTPAKDVDGFHVHNAGRLASGLEGPVPCTPLGCLILLQRVLPSLGGLEAVVIGRSNIVGKPMAALLLRQDCTVTVVHSRTRDLAAVVRRADIVVAAVGRPEMVRGDWIKPGAAVIDVGINRVAAETASGMRLVGDVAFAEVATVAGWVTPVPGGVGPMTVACLLRNTLDAARRAGR